MLLYKKQLEDQSKKLYLAEKAMRAIEEEINALANPPTPKVVREG